MIRTLSPRLLAGFGTLVLLASLGLFASRPAHTAGGPIPVSVANPILAVADTESARGPFQTRLDLHYAHSALLPGPFHRSDGEAPGSAGHLR